MVAAMVAIESGAVAARGMAIRYRPLRPCEASVDAASCRLLGDALIKPLPGSHRGAWLRYALRSLYGSDYRARGAALLGVAAPCLSAMMTGGLRVSRRRVQRLEDALDQRIRNRRKELRALAAAVEAAFAAEYAALGELNAVVAELNRLASQAMRSTDRPIDARSGRFVSRKNVKFPMLREPLK
jgi:DNA-binding transcriptional regulator YdaS (Cro superfamily)